MAETWQEHSNIVAQAAGMVSVQAQCSLQDALGLMQRRALETARTLDDIAAAVVDRSIRFAHHDE